MRLRLVLGVYFAKCPVRTTTNCNGQRGELHPRSSQLWYIRRCWKNILHIYEKSRYLLGYLLYLFDIKIIITEYSVQYGSLHTLYVCTGTYTTCVTKSSQHTAYVDTKNPSQHHTILQHRSQSNHGISVAHYLATQATINPKLHHRRRRYIYDRTPQYQGEWHDI